MKLRRGSVALATALALLCTLRAEATRQQLSLNRPYDGEGALTQITNVGTTPPTVVATFTRDASGRLRYESWSQPTLEQTSVGTLGAGSRQLNWDTSGRLVSVQPTDGNPALSFTYDANGQRQSRAAGPGVSPATYVWGGGELWSEGLQDGTLVHYDRLGDIALAGASQQLMHDPLNSVVGLVGTFTPGSSSSSSGSTGTTSGSSGTTSGTTGTTGTTGGTTGSGVVAAVCGPCESNNECVTGYCERSVGFCEPAGPCSDDSQCFGERCDPATGNCLCGSMQAGTGGTTGSGAGTEALCTTCAQNSDCESGYCDRELSQCQPSAACATTNDCGGLTCNTATGECTCGPTTQVQGLAGRGRAQDSSMQASGTPALQLYRYGAYGGEWLQGGYTSPLVGGQSLSYAGGFDDPYLADSHTLGWRTVQPSTGLFTSQDPLGPDGDPLMSGTGINAFLYANANPSSFTDPDGLAACIPGEPDNACAARLQRTGRAEGTFAQNTLSRSWTNIPWSDPAADYEMRLTNLISGIWSAAIIPIISHAAVELHQEGKLSTAQSIAGAPFLAASEISGARAVVEQIGIPSDLITGRSLSDREADSRANWAILGIGLSAIPALGELGPAAKAGAYQILEDVYLAGQSGALEPTASFVQGREQLGFVTQEALDTAQGGKLSNWLSAIQRREGPSSVLYVGPGGIASTSLEETALLEAKLGRAMEEPYGQLASLRERTGLPAYDPNVSETGAAALAVSSLGRRAFGLNTSFSRAEEVRTAGFELLASIGEAGAARGYSQQPFLLHGEAQALLRLARHGDDLSIVRLFVDRRTCGWCGPPGEPAIGGLRKLARALGIKRLEVYNLGTEGPVTVYGQ